jgi:hypothetical protein
MKQLGKLSISPEKIMKNEELINLKGGGYEQGTCNWSGGSGYSQMCGFSKSNVMWWQEQYGGTWCCDSCHSTSYCQGN